MMVWQFYAATHHSRAKGNTLVHVPANALQGFRAVEITILVNEDEQPTVHSLRGLLQPPPPTKGHGGHGVTLDLLGLLRRKIYTQPRWCDLQLLEGALNF